MRRLIAIAPLVVLVAAALMFGVFSLKRQSRVEPDAMVGQTVPATLLTPLEGGPPQAVTSVKGPILVNFFGSWCVACVVEHPNLVYLSAKGAKLVGVAWRDEPAKTAAFLANRGDPFDLVLMDPKGLAAIDFGITAAPESFVVDTKGRIVFKHTGPIETKAQADRILAELAKAG